MCSLEASRNREEKSYRELVVGESGKTLVKEDKRTFMGQTCSGDLKHSRWGPELIITYHILEICQVCSCHTQKRQLCELMAMLIRLIVTVISQCVPISNHHVVHFIYA